MPSEGQDVLLLTEGEGLSDSAATTGSEEVQYTQALGRGPSSSAVGDDVMLVADGLGQGGVQAELAGTLRIMGDNFYEVWLNGTYLGGRMGDDHINWKTAESYDVSARSGENVLAVKGYNSDGTDGPFTGVDTSGSSEAFVAWGILDNNDEVMSQSRSADVDEIRYTNSDPGSGWDDPDFDDTSWRSNPSLCDPFSKDAVSDDDFPDPLHPYMYWNEEGCNPETQHVDVVWSRCYFTLSA